MQRQYSGVRPSARAGSHQQLRAWQVAVELAVECYLRTAAFPWTERSGLAARMRRAVVSVVSNIAEGHGRSSHRAFGSHLRIARGSVQELDALFAQAATLGYMDDESASRARQLCEDTTRLLQDLGRGIGPEEHADRPAPVAERSVPPGAVIQ